MLCGGGKGSGGGLWEVELRRGRSGEGHLPQDGIRGANMQETNADRE